LAESSRGDPAAVDQPPLFPLPRGDRDDEGGSGEGVRQGDNCRDGEGAHTVVTYLAYPGRTDGPRAVAGAAEGSGTPRHGRRRPYKIEYRYPGQDRVSRIARGDEFDALIEARQLARRGAEVRVFRLERDNNERIELAYYAVGGLSGR
jgi:hypothetical protein